MLETVAYSIAGGMLAVLATASVEQIAWKFLRLAVLIPFAIIVACVVWSLRTASETWTVALVSAAIAGGCALVLILIAPLGQTWSALFRAISTLGGLAGVAAASLAAVAALRSSPTSPQPTATNTTLVVLGQLLGSWVLGSITLAWLLGHAYLTATSMTIAPLRHFSRMLGWSVLARLLFVAVSLGLAWLTLDAETISIFEKIERAWLIAVLRFGVGLVAVGVFAYMVLDCVKLRSTQSATGILYFGSVMAYVGELAAQQLAREVGWPL